MLNVLSREAAAAGAGMVASVAFLLVFLGYTCIRELRLMRVERKADVRGYDSGTIADVLHGEPPHVISVLLDQLPPTVTRAVLERYPTRTRRELALPLSRHVVKRVPPHA